MGTETSAPAVSPQEKAGVGGVETAWGTRKCSVGLAAQTPPWETRKQSFAGGWSNMLRVGKWKATSEGTWEKSWVCASVGEGKRVGAGHHRILLVPQQAHLPAS